MSSKSTLTRKLQSMPSFVKTALQKHKLTKFYNERPPYQRNDYLLWINSAKQDATKRKRLNQMLEELRRGDVYMKMKWNAKK